VTMLFYMSFWSGVITYEYDCSSLSLLLIRIAKLGLVFTTPKLLPIEHRDQKMENK